MAFTLDVTSMTEPAVPAGVRDDDWTGLADRFRAAHQAVAGVAATGVYGYRELEAQAAERTRVAAFATEVAGRYDDIAVLGIGGSSLGAIALRSALLPAAWNARTSEERGGRPRLHVLDNVDPRTITGVLSIVALPRTLFVVISKSGGTVETLAQYLVVRDRLAREGLDAARHLAFVTDPVKGALRAIASRDGIPVFAVPPNVGGRFSVLSPVGTLPAALCGVDIEALCTGAMVMRDATMGDDLLHNAAGLFATLQWRAHAQAGQGQHVMMPYSDALRDLAPWFVQLWAESLGKVDADGLHVGPTPIASVGATDQHSQVLQLLANNLRGVISQRLLRRADGQGRAAALEIMIATQRIKDILRGADLVKLKSTIEQGVNEGMQTFDQHLYALHRVHGLITLDEALASADSPNDLRLRIRGLSSGA